MNLRFGGLPVGAGNDDKVGAGNDDKVEAGYDDKGIPDLMSCR